MTDWTIREPRGFGNQPFGKPTSQEEDKEYKTDGFGDKKTIYTTPSDDK